MASTFVASSLRAERDTKLFESLRARSDVSSALERIGDRHRPSAGRRHLLGSAIRLTPATVPSAFEALRTCLDILHIDRQIELFVGDSPGVQATMFRPDRQRVALAVSAATIERLEPDELVYVLGHELGHLVLEHHELPRNALYDEQLHPEVLLDIDSWSRAAEISADRIGLACCKSLEAAAAVLFKVASGLTRIDRTAAVELLGHQYDMLVDSTGRRNDSEDLLGQTHPLVPIRVHAMQLFEDSVHQGGSLAAETLESRVNEALGLMEIDYLGGSSDRAKAMRRLLFAAGIALADADGDVTDDEIEALETLLDDPVDHRMLDPKAIRAQLPEHVTRVVEAGATNVERRMVVRDLCVIALADGEAHRDELAILYEIAEGFGLTAALVDGTIDRGHDLD